MPFMDVSTHFARFRANIVGNDLPPPFIYADWIASGRLYRPIEQKICDEIGPYVANTHTESTLTGTVMTRAYEDARRIIKKHVGADENDCLVFSGFGMTAAINKLQRLLRLRVPSCLKHHPDDPDRPLVIVTHMEHHSNQITWEECDADVTIIPRDEETGLPDLGYLAKILEANRNRPLLIGAFTAASNVTGIITPYHKMAEMMHAYGGLCFVDFAASAPYVDIDMHPENRAQSLDAIMFSPHKFLGGPGTSGVLVFNKSLYITRVPDQPGGGTVEWTTPFGTHRYIEDIEIREDGGTPGFLQAIKTALCIRLKEEMDPALIREREERLLGILFSELAKESGIFVLESGNRNRIGVVSLYIKGVHHNLVVRLLNDRFGIQTRGGCSCAGTYGHILFNIDRSASDSITCLIDSGDLSRKPGWVRISVHPTMTEDEVRYIGESVVAVIRNSAEWEGEYVFDPALGDYRRKHPVPVPGFF